MSNSTDTAALACGAQDNEITYVGLRIASIFIMMATSMSGTLFPILARKAPWMHVPKSIFDFAKYFGSGVIIATAFIHLLAPAFDELNSPCLTGVWTQYSWAPAFAMMSVFTLFFVELFAFRWGTAKLESLGISTYDVHGHCMPNSHAAHGPEKTSNAEPLPSEAEMEDRGVRKSSYTSSESAHDHGHKHDPHHEHNHHHEHTHDHGHGPNHDPEHLGPIRSGSAQILGVCILEFGVIFHSVIIGLTLAVDPQFITLFIVIVFHQMFEGLGLGSRLAFLDLPHAYRHFPLLGAVAYGLVTPIGIAAGLGVRSSYNPGSTVASIVSGTLDSISAGVLLYTGLVELLAHEFLFNPEMAKASNGKVLYACICMIIGAGIMAVLGRWA